MVLSVSCLGVDSANVLYGPMLAQEIAESIPRAVVAAGGDAGYSLISHRLFVTICGLVTLVDRKRVRR